MQSGSQAITIKVSWRWWLRPYLRTLGFFCVLMQREPDQVKLKQVIARGLRVEVIR